MSLAVPIRRAVICASDDAHLFDGTQTNMRCPACGEEGGIYLVRLMDRLLDVVPSRKMEAAAGGSSLPETASRG